MIAVRLQVLLGFVFAGAMFTAALVAEPPSIQCLSSRGGVEVLFGACSPR